MERIVLSKVSKNLACLLPLVDAPWPFLQSLSFVTVQYPWMPSLSNA